MCDDEEEEEVDDNDGGDDDDEDDGNGVGGSGDALGDDFGDGMNESGSETSDDEESDDGPANFVLGLGTGVAVGMYLGAVAQRRGTSADVTAQRGAKLLTDMIAAHRTAIAQS